MYYVYIIQSKKDGRLYKGFTSDLESRLKEHSEGKAKSTKSFRPWKLVYYEVFADKTDALREEVFLKSGKGRGTLKERLKNYLERYPSG
ncbi:GIY-YIG nuclease family protein [Patescibacteria group bacterium]|nr:GIY-YIG nuclease family protein [Patescibacteria group bacterium]MBU2235869.1 GIY-YIG nuclease family protein [Patescibacteria group bacterium]